MNKAEISILSARDKQGPEFQSGASWVEIKGYIRTGITRGCHLAFRTNPVLFVSS